MVLAAQFSYVATLGLPQVAIAVAAATREQIYS
jgi:hypothetical protein